MADNFQVKITTVGDPAGSDRVAASLDKVAVASHKAGTATKEHGREAEHAGDLLEQLGHRGGAAREAVEGLERATKGGTGGILGMAKAMVALKEGLALGGLSFFGGALLAMIPMFVEWGEKIFGAEEKAKEGAEKATAAFGAEKTAAEKLNEVTLEHFKAELDAISERASAAEKFLAAVFEIQTKIASAAEKLEIAKVDADGSLTSEEKDRKKADIHRQYGRAAEQREDNKANEEIGAKERAAAEARALADRQEKEAAHQEEILKRNREAPEERLRQENELKQHMVEIASERTKNQQNGNTPEAFARDEELRKEMSQTRELYEFLKAKDAAAGSPGGLKDAKSAEDRARQARELAKQSDEKARKAEDDLGNAKSIKSVRDSGNSIIRPTEHAAERVARTKEDIDALGRGEIPKGMVGDVIGRVLPNDFRRLERSHTIIPERANDVQHDAEASGAKTGSELAKAVGDSLSRHFQGISPVFRKLIDAEVRAAINDLKNQFEREISTTQSVQRTGLRGS